MLLTVVPGAVVQVPPLMRKYQGAGPLVRVRSTERSLFTVAARLADGMVNVVVSNSVPQLLSE